MPTFTINKRQFTLERHEALAALMRGTPGLIQKHYVEVGGRQWPVKEALSLLTGLDHGAFTSQHATKVLRALGFDVLQRTSKADPLEDARRDLEAVLRRIDKALGKPGKTDAEVEALLDLRNRLNEAIVLSRVPTSVRNLPAQDKP